MKKQCAKEALKLIENHSVIGLGGGSTIAYLIDEIKEAGLDVKIVTPSFQTQQLCIEKGLHVIATESVDCINLAFDGCDEVDDDFCALKSGGGIHTKEKIIGSMAKDYVLLVDEGKLYPSLGFEHPVVLEVVKDSYRYVIKQVKALGGNCQLRTSLNKDGGIISDQGLLLLDAMFDKAKVHNIKQLHDDLKSIVGVLEISLFYQVATKVLIARSNGFELRERTR